MRLLINKHRIVSSESVMIWHVHWQGVQLGTLLGNYTSRILKIENVQFEDQSKYSYNVNTRACECCLKCFRYWRWRTRTKVFFNWLLSWSVFTRSKVWHIWPSQFERFNGTISWPNF